MRRKTLRRFLTSLIILTIFVLPLPSTYATVPRLLNYQARLTDKDNKPLAGSYNITLRVYDAETAGNLLWQETHKGVVIKENGLLTIMLGSVNNLNLPFDKPYFLAIQINGEPEMSLRQRITSVGYVYRSESADNDLPKGAIIMWSGSIASIPQGWTLCDGNNGTPDLRDRFILGAGGALPQTGGTAEVTLTLQQLPNHKHLNPSHTHIGPAHTHKGPLHQHTQTEHTHGIGSSSVGCEDCNNTAPGFMTSWFDKQANHTTMEGGGGLLTGSAGSGETSLSGAGDTTTTGIYTSYEGNGKAQTNLPPYYALAYIMKL